MASRVFRGASGGAVLKLFKEYAIDPAVLSNWKDARYFIDNTGVRRGRLIAEFPRSWFQMVMDACSACSPCEKIRILERLRQAKDSHLVAASRPYQPERLWPDNAITEHERQPFDGVVLKEGKEGGDKTVVPADDIDEDCACWKTSTDMVVRRTAEDMAKVAAPLLRAAKQIVFVDQHFNFTNAYLDPLSRFLAEAMRGAAPTRLEYHWGDKTGESRDVERQIRARLLPRLRPLGTIEMSFVRWRKFENVPADKMHPRYILTEKGGLRFDYGLGEGNEGETTDVGILDSGVYKRRWHDFLPESETYEFLDGWSVRSGVVRPVHPANGLFVAAA